MCETFNTDTIFDAEPRTTTGVTGSDAAKPTESSSGAGNYTTSGNLNPSDSDVTGASRYTGFTQNAKIAPLEDNYNPAGGVNKSEGKSEGTTESKPATTEKTGDVNESGRDKASSGPAKELGSSTEAGKDMSKAQQDVRDPEDPQTDPKESAKKSNVDDTDQNPDRGGHPDKDDGPGPRSMEELAKEGGGDAGKTSGEGSGEGGDDEDEGDGPQKKSHGSGTGEQYVKSSGLKADGGDFDATKPGAGREADRMSY